MPTSGITILPSAHDSRRRQTCPNCRTEIKLTELLAMPLIAATRRDHEKKMTVVARLGKTRIIKSVYWTWIRLKALTSIVVIELKSSWRSGQLPHLSRVNAPLERPSWRFATVSNWFGSLCNSNTSLLFETPICWFSFSEVAVGRFD